MHSLPILLIILALLPFSAALKCHNGTYMADVMVHHRISQVKDCPDSHVCMWFTGSNSRTKLTVWNCARKGYTKEDCTKNSCQSNALSIKEDGIDVKIPGTACCCVGDLCNGQGKAPKPPGPAVPPTAPKSHIGKIQKTNGHVDSSESKVETCHEASNCAWVTSSAVHEGKTLKVTKWMCGVDAPFLQRGATHCNNILIPHPYDEDRNTPANACFCDGDLCNGQGKAPKPPGPTPPSDDSDDDNDDDDEDDDSEDDPPTRAKAAPTTLRLSLAAAAAALLAARV